MFALLVVFVLSLVFTVFLSGVDGAAGQISQQVLDKQSYLAGPRSHTDIEVCGFVA